MTREFISGLRPTTEVGTNPKDAYGMAKVPLTAIPSSSLVFMAIAMKVGAEKYGFHNWRVSKVQSRIYLEAAWRHLAALIDGEDFDTDTGIHHGGFVMACVGIVLDALVTGQLIDNRVLPGKTGALLTLFNQLPNESTTPENMRAKLENFLGQQAFANTGKPQVAKVQSQANRVPDTARHDEERSGGGLRVQHIHDPDSPRTTRATPVKANPKDILARLRKGNPRAHSKTRTTKNR